MRERERERGGGYFNLYANATMLELYHLVFLGVALYNLAQGYLCAAWRTDRTRNIRNCFVRLIYDLQT